MDAMVNGAPNSPLPSSPGPRAPARDDAAATDDLQLIMKAHDLAPPLSRAPAAVPARNHHPRCCGLLAAGATAAPGPDPEAQLISNGGGGSTYEGAGAIIDDATLEHWHYSHTSPWRKALVLGANDGLFGVSSLMLGVGAVKRDVRAMVVSGLAGLVAGAGSIAIGEFVSVFSQRDTQLADIEKERQEHAKGPEAQARELEELAQIYVRRGLPYYFAKQVAEELSKVDVLKAHARDELGIDVDALSNPLQAALASALASALGFFLGGGVPLLAGAFVVSYKIRMAIVVVVSSVALVACGAARALLGEPICRATITTLVRGWLVMAIPYVFLKVLVAIGF